MTNCLTPRRMRLPMVVSLLHAVVLLTASSSVVADDDKKVDDCGGGACPIPADMNGQPAYAPVQESECGLWLGPSPIKEAEEHGFGLSMFTGRSIPKGTSVERLFYGSEPLLPIFDSTLDANHPPLREYVWGVENMPEINFDVSHGDVHLFMPGAAAIVPCTSQNFNMALSGTGTLFNPARDGLVADSTGVHRAKNPMAGSFSYRYNVTYTAVRDIVAGEELTVECDDDDFDGGAYYLSRFKPNDNAVICLDDKMRVGESNAVSGRGLFAKKHLKKESVLISTPLIPINRKDMVMPNHQDQDIQREQLLLNYCFGHPRSDLLLLPYGPMVNYINHAPKGQVANAEIRWWHPDAADNSKLSRRQQHHHAELLDLPAATVADTHGKGLMMDIVALRNIGPNEEIYIDYGPDWTKAWDSHVQKWGRGDEDYLSAWDHVGSTGETELRTVAEQETRPYPDNTQTVCYFNEPQDSETQEDTVSWNQGPSSSCLRPCDILDRYEKEPGVFYYKARMPAETHRDEGWCKLSRDYEVTDIPRKALELLDRPYTVDTFLPSAFRHEIGVPQGFYPETWMRKRVRRPEASADEDGAMFKRKNQKNINIV